MNGPTDLTEKHEHRPDEIEGEPFFTLMARDDLAPGMVALYAALRSRQLHAVSDIVRNLVVTSGKMHWHPTHDPEHAISARQVANRMRTWAYANRPKVPTNARAVEIDGVTDPEPQP